MLNFGASKPRVKGGAGPPGPPLDPHLYTPLHLTTMIGITSRLIPLRHYNS